MEEINKNFAFKDLMVWQKSMVFAINVIDLSENLNSSNRHFRLIEQLEAAVASIGQNIAEGKGRKSKKEFVQYLYIARGSLYETVTLLNLFERKNWITREQLLALEAQAIEIASMLKGLINSILKSDQ